MSNTDCTTKTETARGMLHPGVIDFLGFDEGAGEVVLGMMEERPWDGSEKQLFQIQEKMNAYFSFILDGEMEDAYPQFRGKKVRIRMECVGMPPEEAVKFLQAVYDQAQLQGIEFELDVLPDGKGVATSGSCGCGSPADCCGG